MIELFPTKECCAGCSACENICPRQAISMLPDENGFLYPQINQEICIECGLCKKVCDFQNAHTVSQSPVFNVYAAKNKDVEKRRTSQSGGISALLTDYILNQGGVVYGVAFDETFKVVHKRIVNVKDASLLKGSKYVQSFLGKSFAQIKKDLQVGRKVLFTGTPCQVAGLRKYLGEGSTESLFTCDIICHGVPSPKMWKDYIHYIEKKYKEKIVKANFRDSCLGWTDIGYVESFLLTNKGKIFSKTYGSLFAQDFLRSSCANCPYACLQRVGDITVGDCWGIEIIYPEFNDKDAGVSLVLVNSDKGIQLFKEVSESMEIIDLKTTEWWIQPNLRTSSILSPHYDQFWKDYSIRGFEYVMNKYVIMEDRKKKVKFFLWKLLTWMGIETFAQQVYRKLTHVSSKE